MKGFKLIKKYPGSPELGFEIHPSGRDVKLNVICYHPEKYPEYWEKTEEDLCPFMVLLFDCTDDQAADFLFPRRSNVPPYTSRDIHDLLASKFAVKAVTRISDQKEFKICQVTNRGTITRINYYWPYPVSCLTDDNPPIANWPIECLTDVEVPPEELSLPVITMKLGALYRSTFIKQRNNQPIPARLVKRIDILEERVKKLKANAFIPKNQHPLIGPWPKSLYTINPTGPTILSYVQGNFSYGKGKTYVSKRPPLGIIPLAKHNENRLADINAAIERYLAENKDIPAEWLKEKQNLEKK